MPAGSSSLEEERLQALLEYRILDTAPENAFDTVAELAAKICGVPIAAVTFVDSRRQWLKAKIGLNLSEAPRETSFCSHAIAQKGLFLVPDARSDQRFAANPFVIGPPNIRSYAGAPLTTAAGTSRPTQYSPEHH